VASHGRAASSLPDASLRADAAGVGAQMHQPTASSAAFSVR
jgi:hypothetical protein